MALTPVKLTNATDTYVTEGTDSKNFANGVRLGLRGTGNLNYAYIYFARPFPLGVTVISATLRLYQRDDWTGANTLTIKKITESWKVGRTTFANQPDVTSVDQKALTKTGSAQYTAWEFDVQNQMQAVADGAKWYGWRIQTDSATRLWINSSQAAGHKPVLEVVYTERPDAPTTLSPSGGRVVAVNRPVLRFDFTDTAGNTDLRAVQIQTNTSNSFTSPAFNSGEVITDEPSYDLAAGGAPSTASGGTTWWRVRVQDGAGLWSPYSEPASFSYRAPVSVTMTNPSGNFIDEPTPPIIWSVTGTQTQWQVIVRDDENTIIHNSGKHTGTENSYTIPRKIIRRDDTEYRIIVRVWDAYSRESTPSAPAYTQVSRDVTYRYDATINPVTNLTATESANGPGVVLTWNRTAAPDYFVVRRNGVVVIDDLDPADILQPNGTYVYEDKRAEPRKAQTWRVNAVVNGKTSNNNPAIVFTPEPVGIWLTDEDRNISVQLLDTDEGSWSMGEESAVFSPVGSDKSLVVTQALRGYEGSISGLLLDTGNKTVAQQEADMFDLKRTPGQTYVLTLSNMTIPVVIGNVVVAPTPRKEIEKVVSFDFWQVDDIPFRARL